MTCAIAQVIFWFSFLNFRVYRLNVFINKKSAIKFENILLQINFYCLFVDEINLIYIYLRIRYNVH